MLTINSSFPVLMIEIRKKLKKSTKYQACGKFTKNMHMPQFFQPTLLNSKFLYKRGALIARLELVNIPVPAQRRKF